jgi:hypothetical protein
MGILTNAKLGLLYHTPFLQSECCTHTDCVWGAAIEATGIWYYTLLDLVVCEIDFNKQFLVLLSSRLLVLQNMSPADPRFCSVPMLGGRRLVKAR